jgi:hypothetical protein
VLAGESVNDGSGRAVGNMVAYSDNIPSAL